jgi:hypothetical protein
MMAAGGSVDLKSVRQVVRDSFELATYEPKNSAAWDARLAE